MKMTRLQRLCRREARTWGQAAVFSIKNALSYQHEAEAWDVIGDRLCLQPDDVANQEALHHARTRARSSRTKADQSTLRAYQNARRAAREALMSLREAGA